MTNDSPINLPYMKTAWQPSSSSAGVLKGRGGATGESKWTGARIDLIFGSSSQLRATAKVYAYSDSRKCSVKVFVAARNKAVNLDCFDAA